MLLIVSSFDQIRSTTAFRTANVDAVQSVDRHPEDKAGLWQEF